ncbi:MAG: PEP/pyruvate-binding domain-containing protein [Tenuifilaceae bacterium]|jgi:CheY-like chemotaxis protein|nr:PEP/pyruvate-binding domain-containing protein [Tenuifilaceae bacterium]
MQTLQEYKAAFTLDFSETAFDMLMQKRIYRVLLICSHYDAFMLEEDGRIDEQIFNEYVSLSLRYPPSFIQVHSAREALEVINSDEKIDLIISMLNVGDVDTFELAKLIKKRLPQVPLVILTHFSREVSVRLEREDLTGIDYIFSWLGNADLLLAIIKLIEDRMNADNDILEVGVQSIIVVEDSVRYYSTMMPLLYKIVMRQARSFMQEALNEHKRVLRMRGRPKILLAKNYNEALELYNRYKPNVLGVISDVSFKVNQKRDQEGKLGLKLCEQIRQDDPNMPFLLQSSDITNQRFAKDLGVGFIHKYVQSYNIDLRDYIIANFGFGDFIFYDPKTNQEICRAEDLPALQKQLLTVADDSLIFHSTRDHLSKWLNARALFSVGQLFKPLSINDFHSLDEARKFLYHAISAYRTGKNRGVIAMFDPKRFDEYRFFTRIGNGSIGGKARGLAFVNTLIKDNQLYNKYPNVVIAIPRTVVISTEFYDEFLDSNNLFKVGMSDMPDHQILGKFLDAQLPQRLIDDLRVVITVLTQPIAVRSSSKLEDSHYQPFAGIYSTYMVPSVSNKEQMLQMLQQAIKSVYASVFFKASKAYMAATSNVIDEEKMGIILQEVCGNQHGDVFLPTLSGVARSINFYPIGSEKPEHGIATVGYGLGKLIVDGGISLRFSPKFPKKILQLSQPDMAVRETQKLFYALDMRPQSFVPSTDDGVNLLKLDVNKAENYADFEHVASTYDFQNHSIIDSIHASGKKVVTFANILKYNTFPLASILGDLLEIGQKEMNCPVEIEFAANLNVPNDMPKIFNLLQIRPIVENEQSDDFPWDQVNLEDAIIYSQSALGHGRIDNISDVVYVKPQMFNPANTKQIAQEVEYINRQYMDDRRNYVLVGPGRWGSSDPWLGIPIKWSQISEARAIVESGLENFRIDPSQGTHFFQNLTSFRVGYLTVNPYINDGIFDVDFLNSQPAHHETDHVRCIRFNESLLIHIDGKNNKGVVFKPQKGNLLEYQHPND